MDCRYLIPLSICFLFLLPRLSLSAIQLRGLLGDKNTPESVLRLNGGAFSPALDPTRVTQLSWRPRAFVYKGFLTDGECDHLIKLSRDKLEKSMVADNESGKSIMSEVRTSSGMFLQKAQLASAASIVLGITQAISSRENTSFQSTLTVSQCKRRWSTDSPPLLHMQHQSAIMIILFLRLSVDAIVAEIEARIAAWTFLPVENGEAMQVLHYEHGEKYEPHFDFFHDKANQELGGHRVATVLMYLSDIEKGGETIFPNSEVSQPKDDVRSDCAKNGYAVKPKKGDALLFFSLHPDATTDTYSLHGSCPVIEGEKWSATKWIHVRSFDKPAGDTDSGDCVDLDENCPMWAKTGECEKNPLYMVGSNNSSGKCRKSCKVCSS
ncbi:hypothetical protein I3760_03G024800 [Carya illinoinensis]|nr:hypothetical protein I3760_03G024800 [Carya illinoinensis]